MPAATYDITTHSLLSEKAKALLASSPDDFDSVAVAAERNIGLHDTSFTGEQANDAKLAVVYEVNFQLERTAESEVHKRVQRRGRTWEFSDKTSSPSALRIASRLLASLKSTQERSSRSQSISVEHVW